MHLGPQKSMGYWQFEFEWVKEVQYVEDGAFHKVLEIKQNFDRCRGQE